MQNRMLNEFQNIRNKLPLLTPRLFKKKPRFLFLAVFKLLSQKLLKSDPLTGIEFATHYRCNLNCRHCYEKKFRETPQKPLSTEDQIRIICECLDTGVIAFDFVGGETILNPDFPRLVKACKPSQTYISLATNGWLLTEEKIRQYLHIGVDKINISLDSWHSEEHDYNRRKNGSHQRTLKAIDLCRDFGMDISLNIVVYRNYTKTEGFQKAVKFASEKRIRLYFKAAVPLGAWQADYSKLITRDDCENMLALHRKSPLFARDSYGGCPAFQRVVAITAYGDVMPCNCIPISFGNLRNEKLSEILVKGRKIDYFNGRFNGCPPAECINFIETFLSKTYDAYPYPPLYENIFPNEKPQNTIQ